MDRLNKVQIDQLKFCEDNADEVLIDSLLAIFDGQMRDLLIQMRMLHRDGFGNKVSELAHRLKSSAGQLGLVRVEKICLEIETEGRRKSAFGFEESFKLLELESVEGVRELREYLKSYQMKTGA